MSVMIGIDPHKGSQAAAAVDDREVAVAELEVRSSRRQTRELLAWAERFPMRRWAIESANGHGYLLAQQLIAAGEHVVDVPSTLSARVRVLDSTRSQKNDRNDARSVAIVAQQGLPVSAEAVCAAAFEHPPELLAVDADFSFEQATPPAKTLVPEARIRTNARTNSTEPF